MKRSRSRSRRLSPGLRGGFLLYLVILHVVFAVIAAILLREHRLWWLAVEGFFVISALLAFRLLRALFEPLRLLQASTSFLRERDFATRLRATGMPELEELIEIYNQMAEELREERIRNEEQESFLRKLLSISPLGVILFDFDQRIATLNRAAEVLLGVRSDDVLGVSLVDLVGSATLAPGASRRRFIREMATLAIGDSAVLALRGRRRVRVVKSQLFDRGHPRQFLLMEELTEELHRTEKAAYDRLIRLMSHEVNNTTGAVTSLLQSCLGYARQLSQEDRQEFTQALDVAIRRSMHMNEFMRRFADVIRLPAPQKRPTDVAELVDTMLRLLRQEAQERRIEITWRLRERVPLVSLDTAQMEQVLLNVLRNALEAIDEDGRITLSLRQRNGRVELQIEDTGKGLSEETRQHLFTPFYTTKQGGQGIGLTLVREILEAHRFDYSLDGVESQSTRFTISL